MNIKQHIRLYIVTYFYNIEDDIYPCDIIRQKLIITHNTLKKNLQLKLYMKYSSNKLH